MSKPKFDWWMEWKAAVRRYPSLRAWYETLPHYTYILSCEDQRIYWAIQRPWRKRPSGPTAHTASKWWIWCCGRAPTPSPKRQRRFPVPFPPPSAGTMTFSGCRHSIWACCARNGTGEPPPFLPHRIIGPSFQKRCCLSFPPGTHKRSVTYEHSKKSLSGRRT